MSKCNCGQGTYDFAGRLIEFHALDCPASPLYEAFMESLTSPEFVVCPDCNGYGLMTGDGSGYDGGGTYHDPGCATCSGTGAVPAELVQS